jgi:hypothetical protein
MPSLDENKFSGKSRNLIGSQGPTSRRKSSMDKLERVVGILFDTPVSLYEEHRIVLGKTYAAIAKVYGSTDGFKVSLAADPLDANTMRFSIAYKGDVVYTATDEIMPVMSEEEHVQYDEELDRNGHIDALRQKDHTSDEDQY